jgi:hypothetical protein
MHADRLGRTLPRQTNQDTRIAIPAQLIVIVRPPRLLTGQAPTGHTATQPSPLRIVFFDTITFWHWALGTGHRPHGHPAACWPAGLCCWLAPRHHADVLNLAHAHAHVHAHTRPQPLSAVLHTPATAPLQRKKNSRSVRPLRSHGEHASASPHGEAGHKAAEQIAPSANRCGHALPAGPCLLARPLIASAAEPARCIPYPRTHSLPASCLYG